MFVGHYGPRLCSKTTEGLDGSLADLQHPCWRAPAQSDSATFFSARAFREVGLGNAMDSQLSDDVSAASEANGTTVPVSLDLGGSLSIQPSEGSRSRVRRTRSAMGIQSIYA